MTTAGFDSTVRQRPTETFAAGLAALVLLLGAFVLLAVLVSIHPILAIDVEIERAVQSVRAPWLDAAAFGLSFLGFPPWSIVIDAVIVLAIAVIGQRWAALCAGIAAAGSAALWFAVLEFVHRPRPTPDLVNVVAKIGYGSFPSGHALNTLAFYGFLAVLALRIEQRWPRRVLVVLLCLIPLGIGWSRIYVGEHWPTDVLGGYLLGGAWLVMTRRIYGTGTWPAALGVWHSKTN